MNTDDVLRKYGAKIENQVRTTNVENINYSGTFKI